MTNVGLNDHRNASSIHRNNEPDCEVSPATYPLRRTIRVVADWTLVFQGRQVRTLLLTVSLAVLAPTQAGPFDVSADTTAPAFGEAHFGDVERAYGGAALEGPAAFRAAPEDFGDRGPVLVKNRDGSSHGCVASRYDGLTYSHCDPFAVKEEDLPPGTTLTTEPGVIPSIRRQ